MTMVVKRSFVGCVMVDHRRYNCHFFPTGMLVLATFGGSWQQLFASAAFDQSHQSLVVIIGLPLAANGGDD